MAKSANPKKKPATKNDDAKPDDQSKQIKVRKLKLTSRADELVERIPMGARSEYVSKCIEICGSSYLQEFKAGVRNRASIESRLNYLEEFVGKRVYDEFVDSLSSVELKAHKGILKKVNKKTWHNKESISAIKEAAQENEHTEETSTAEWQAILRNRDAFLKYKAK